MTDCCAPACAPEKPDPRYRRVLWIALLINAAMFGVEVVAGLAASSVSLLADAIDFFGDAANYGITLFVLALAPVWRSRAALIKGANASHPWSRVVPRLRALFSCCVYCPIEVPRYPPGRPALCLDCRPRPLLTEIRQVHTAVRRFLGHGHGARRSSTWNLNTPVNAGKRGTDVRRAR